MYLNASYVHQKNNCNHRVERLVAQKLVLPKSSPEDHFWLPKMVLWTPLANSGPNRTAIGNRNCFGRQFLAVKSGLWDQFELPQWSCFPVLTTEEVEWVYTSNAHATITDVSPKAQGCSGLFMLMQTHFLP